MKNRETGEGRVCFLPHQTRRTWLAVLPAPAGVEREVGGEEAADLFGGEPAMVLSAAVVGS